MKSLVLTFLFVTCFGLSVNAKSANDFFRLSNVEYALAEGDCPRYGGYRYKGDVAKLALKLSKKGTSVGSYRNVRKYRGVFYVMWMYRSGPLVTAEWCIFK